MAYENAKETVVAEIKKNNRGDFIVVKNILDEGRGSQSIDVRQCFTNDDDQVLPTKKGIRYNSELAVEVIKAQADCLEASDLQDLIEELHLLAIEKGCLEEAVDNEDTE